MQLFFNNKFLEWIFENATKDPLLQDCEVGLRRLFEQESEKFSYTQIRTVYHKFVDHIQKSSPFFVTRLYRQSAQVVHYSNAPLNVEPDLLQSQVCLHEFCVELGHQKQILFE